MTSAFPVQPLPRQGGPSAAAVVGIVLVAAVAVVTLLTAGITFVSLAIAFPLAVPIAERFDVVVSASDIAIAQVAAGFWWAFAALAAASFGAALLVIVAAIRALDPTPRS